MKTFSFRFDIDSLADIEIGVPRLIELGKELNVRFTFFVNMGRSFNWKTIAGSRQSAVITRSRHTSTLRKLGFWRVFRTVAVNPNIGITHKKILFKLLDNGHELGLHGGMDHPLWQWRLDTLTKDEINNLLKPAYDDFVKLFGKPKGFTSPGFRYNRYVLELMDEYSFEYASDMAGERPFRPEGFKHIQIPVNVIGADKRPLIEYLRVSSFGKREIEEKVMAEVARRECAVIYGHPSFEARFEKMGEFLTRVKENGYGIVCMGELLEEDVKGFSIDSSGI